jgi:Flp pilus assembly protein CpaB
MGAVAAVAAYGYLNGVQVRANNGAKLVKVYVIKKDVKKGTTGDQALADNAIVAGAIPAKYRPDTALLRSEQLKGQVALVDLAPNQVVVDGLFVDPKVAVTTNSERLDPGLVGVSVSLDAVRGVNGLITPGDEVNIMTQVALDKKRLSAGSQTVLKDAKDGDIGWTVLYQNVKVLFVGASAAPQPGGTKAAVAPAGGLITFAVPQEAALRIVFAANDPKGGLYLTLVPPNNPAVDTAPVVAGTEFGPPCQGPGPDGRFGTLDDNPANCVPLTPYPPPAAQSSLVQP